MTTRLHVRLDDAEYREIQRAADAEQLTVAAWVRRALVDEYHRQALGDTDQKIRAVQQAAQ